MKLSTYLRLVRLSALYDLVVTAPFATPWSAAAVLEAMRRLHAWAGAPGAPPPAFATTHLFFVSLFGTIVVLWSVLRLWRTRPEHGLFDGFGRAFFSAWMLVSLASGGTTLVVVFLVPEVVFGLLQLGGFARLPGPARAAALA